VLTAELNGVSEQQRTSAALERKWELPLVKNNCIIKS
jgi:hypothetical protein